MIVDHIKFLLDNDPIFARFWNRKSEREKSESISFASEIDCVKLSGDNSGAKLAKLADRSRRYFSCVPQKDMDYSRRPADWIDFVSDESAKAEQLDLSFRFLERFLVESKYSLESRLYGNTKSVKSLDSKFGEVKTGSEARRVIRDTWDAVRFRIVCLDLHVVRAIAIEAWQWYFDEICKCRNYYLYPRDDVLQDPYGAIHFEIEITEGRLIELQLLTEGRDLAGFLDHALMHKKKLKFLDAEHERWLRKFRNKVFVWDSKNIPNSQLRLPSVK